MDVCLHGRGQPTTWPPAVKPKGRRPAPRQLLVQGSCPPPTGPSAASVHREPRRAEDRNHHIQQQNTGSLLPRWPWASSPTRQTEGSKNIRKRLCSCLRPDTETPCGGHGRSAPAPPRLPGLGFLREIKAGHTGTVPPNAWGQAGCPPTQSVLCDPILASGTHHRFVFCSCQTAYAHTHTHTHTHTCRHALAHTCTFHIRARTHTYTHFTPVHGRVHTHTLTHIHAHMRTHIHAHTH